MLPTSTPPGFTFERTSLRGTSEATKTLISVPPVIDQLILEYPNPEDLRTLSQVSKRFDTLCNHPALWRRFCDPHRYCKDDDFYAHFKKPENRLGKFIPTDPPGIRYLQKNNPQVIVSPTIVKYIKSDKLSLLEYRLLSVNSAFICHLPYILKRIDGNEITFAEIVNLPIELISKLSIPGAKEVLSTGLVNVEEALMGSHNKP